jgi:hypothetical protein
MKTLVLKPSAAQTAGTTGAGIQITEDEDSFASAVFILDVTAAATAAGDTLDVYVDLSPDGSSWVNAIHFTQVLGNGGAKKEIAKLTAGELNDPDAVWTVAADAASGVVRNTGLMPFVRYRSAITDATTDDASFTYSLVAVLQ